MSNDWMSRLGASSAATTPTGSAPAYGMAFDLARGEWVSATQFRQFAEDATATTHAATIDAHAQRIKSMHDQELERAQRIDAGNLDTDAHASWFQKAMSIPKAAYNEASRMVGEVGGADSSDELWTRYSKAGGLLSKDEFYSLSGKTQGYLAAKAHGVQDLSTITSVPGVSQALSGLNYATRVAVSTPADMVAQSVTGSNYLPWKQDWSNWFSGASWAKAWRESNDQPFGNALVNAVLSPAATQDQLDEWAKHSSLYQMTSLGSELLAGWYADPGVIAGQAVGATARAARGEAFLNETSGASVAMRQALHREQITVRNPISRKLGEARANSMIEAEDRVQQAALNTSLSQFSGHAPLAGGRRITMFGGRTINGDAASAAIWHAARIAKDTNDQGIWDLTMGALHGDPKAYARINTLKDSAVEDLHAFSPGAQTVFDAVEATKTKANQLESEIEDLQAQQGRSGNSIYDWVNDRSLALKQQDLADAKAKLQRYERYPTWYNSLIPGNPDQARPLLNRVSVPKSATWGTNANADAAPRGPRSKFFVDNQYGMAHSFFHVPKASLSGWKANLIEAHDVASGPTSFERQLGNLKRLFAYDAGADGLEKYIRAWHDAPDEKQRINVAAAFENEHVMKAVAQFYNKSRPADQQIPEEVFRGIYQHVIEQQNNMLMRLNSSTRFGTDAVYTPNTMPTTPQRAEMPGESVQLVKRNDDGSVQLELMDRGHVTTMVVPKEAWALKAIHDGEKPVFEPQTPNYYNPIDAWRFHAELQRNPELLETLNAAFGTEFKASMMRGIDRGGTFFNNFWKPTVLFRLGWPMRVLMDEGARGFAVLGPMSFAKHYGGAAGVAIANSVVKGIDGSERVLKALAGHRDAAFDLGGGPIRTQMRRTPLRTPGELPAPEVPEEFLPQPSAKVLNSITDQAARVREWERTPMTGERPAGPLDHLPAKRPENGHLEVWGLDGQTEGGFAVPLPHTAMDLAEGKSVDVRKGMRTRFAQKWANVLADKRYQVAVTPDGNLTVARTFTPKERAKAQAFLRYIHDTYNGSEMHDLKSGETFHYVDEPMPIEEQSVDRGLALPTPGDELAEFDNLIDDPQGIVRRKLLRDREMGRGMLKLKSSDGHTVEVPAPYEGHLGQIMYGLSGSEKTIDYISAGHGRALSWQRRAAVGYKTYSAPEMTDKALQPGTREHTAAVDYFTRWADMVNDHLGSSPVVQKMLRGASDQDVATWLTTTEEGGRVRRMMLSEHDDPLLWANEVRYRLDKYLPSRELQRRLTKGRLAPSDLRKYVADEDLPDVIGPELEQLDGRFSGKRFLNAFMDKAWKVLAEAPIDTLSRHPFYSSQYQLKVKALTRSLNSKFLDEKMLDVIHKQAHAYAMNQTKRHLWSLVDQTNFSEATRFIFPFWAAQREAIAKWAQIISDRPETVARFLMTQRAAYNHLQVVDQDGNPVHDRVGGIYGTNWHPNDRIIVQIPRVLDKVPGIGQALREMGSVGIPTGSVNTVLQGESPMLPGFGPLITIPADKFLRWQSATMGVPQDAKGLYAHFYNWLFPIGRPRQGGVGGQAINPLNAEFWSGIASQVLPGWAKRVQESSPGLASANSYFLIARQMQMDAQEAGKPMPTPQQIDKVVNRYSALRVLTGLLAPFQVEYRPKDQFFLDQYHAYQRKYGVEADTKFLDDFGVQYARYVTSSSNSPVGVPGTGKGLREAVANKDLLQKYGDTWGSAIVSPDAYSDPFNYDAYSAEFQIPVGPGSSDTLRKSLDPKTRDEEADRTAGWYEYQKLNNAITAELASRGLKSIQQSGAQDLAALKRAALEGSNGKPGLADQYPAWYQAYTQGAEDIYSRVHQLSQWVWDKRFDSRADIKGVRQYLLIRKQVTDALDSYSAATGGSRSLQSEEAQQSGLTSYFYDRVGELIQSNPAFAEFYVRYLEGDTLAKGSGGF